MSSTALVSRPPHCRRYALIGCEVLFREICHLSATCPHTVDHLWQSQGLHDLGAERMSARLQQVIDDLPADTYDAVLLAFALCNNGVLGLTARDCPLVIPKAHDCISLFLGSRHRYREEFDAHPGTFFLTSGWIERDEATVEDAGGTIADRLGLVIDREALIEEYGEENAAFIAEQMGDLTAHYDRLAYIEMGFEENLGFRDVAAAEAQKRGWRFAELAGDLDLLRRLLSGTWDEDFVVARPGETLQASHDDDVLCRRPAD